MKFKKLVSALTLGTLLSTVALGTVSCLDASTQEQVDQDFLENYNIQELEQLKEQIQFDGDSVNLMPGATCEIPIISEEGNIIYDYVSSDRDIAVIVEKDGKGIIVAGEKEGQATITVRGSNNKIGYFKVNVSNVIAPSEDEDKTGAASNISEVDLANSLPSEIRLNGSEKVRKVTILEGESVIINPTLYPSNANGLWKIYWQYDRLNGDDPNYPSNPGYFYYNITDSSTKSTLGSTPEEQAEGFWKDGQKMGYRVEVFGVRPRKTEGDDKEPLRKLICETVGGLRKEIEVEVISATGDTAKASIVYPQISVIGNKGNIAEAYGTASTYITAIGYPNDEGLTYTAESLNPSVFTVSNGDNFNSGGLVSINPKAPGTGYVRVTMGRSTAVCKVEVKKQYITHLGNMQLTICAKKAVEGGDADGRGNGVQQYPKERVFADSVTSQVWGTCYPTSANGGLDENGTEYTTLYFQTDCAEVGADQWDVVSNKAGEVKLYDGGHFKSEDIRLDRKYKRDVADSYKAMRGCYLYISSYHYEDKDGDRMRANSDFNSFVMPFAVHNNKGSTTNESAKSDYFKDGLSTSNADTTQDPSPIYLLMKNTTEDLVKDTETAGYVQIADSLYVRRNSLLTRYKTSDTAAWTAVNTSVESGKSYTLPTGWTDPWHPGEGEVKKVLNKTGDKYDVTVTNYTFDKWVAYNITDKTLGSDKITSLSHDSGKPLIAVALFNKKETTSTVDRWEYDKDEA